MSLQSRFILRVEADVRCSDHRIGAGGQEAGGALTPGPWHGPEVGSGHRDGPGAQPSSAVRCGRSRPQSSLSAEVAGAVSLQSASVSGPCKPPPCSGARGTGKASLWGRCASVVGTGGTGMGCGSPQPTRQAEAQRRPSEERGQDVGVPGPGRAVAFSDCD